MDKFKILISKDMQKDIKLNEFMDLYPNDLEFQDNVGGINIYSNIDIINTLKEKVEKQIHYNILKEKIIDLIDRKIISIGYTEKNFSLILKRFKHWSHKFFHKEEFNTLAIYVPENKIAIILDDNVTILGNEIEKLIPRTLHEMCHLLAGINTNKFVNYTLYDYLIPYYEMLLYRINPETSNIPKNILINTIKTLAHINEGKNIDDGDIYEAAIIWKDYFEKFTNNKQATIYAKRLLTPYLRNISQTLKHEYYDISNKIEEYLYDSYLSLGIESKRLTAPGQEVINPSEILAVISQIKVIPEIISLVKDI